MKKRETGLNPRAIIVTSERRTKMNLGRPCCGGSCIGGNCKAAPGNISKLIK